MYLGDIQDLPSNYRKSSLNHLFNEIDPSNSVNFYAPSGFGKSHLFRFISFNRSYKRHYKSARNYYFAYVDANELAVKAKSVLQLNTINNPQAVTLQEVAEEEIKSALELMTTVQRLTNNNNQKIKDYISAVIHDNPKAYFFIIIDGVEQLVDTQYQVMLDVFKYIRDRYRGRLDYIFGISQGDFIEKKDYSELGSIAPLLGRKIVSIPLEPNSEQIFKSMYKGNKLLLLFTKKRNKQRLIKVDTMSGGYAPYIKYLLGRREPLDLVQPLPVELKTASMRLKNSLSQNQYNCIKNLLLNNYLTETNSTKALFNLRILHKDNEGIRLFSPIMHKFILEENTSVQ